MSAEMVHERAARTPRRWRISLLLTIFAFLFMYAAERHADQLRQSPAAYKTASGR